MVWLWELKAAALPWLSWSIEEIHILLGVPGLGAEDWDQMLIVFFIDAVALTDYIIQLSFIQRAVWTYITVENGYVGQIFDT